MELMKEEYKEILKGMPMLERVATFLVLMGEETTVRIFQHLPKNLVEDISTQIAQTNSIDKDTSLAILTDFHMLIRSSGYLSSGGFEYAKEILYKSLGKGDADDILSRLSKIKLAAQAFSYLDAINPKQLSDFIKDESPQTIAVILAHMEPAGSAEVLMQLDEEARVKVALQMATIKDVSPDVVRTVSIILEKKLESLLSSIVDVGGVKVVADMLNRIGPKSQDILRNIDNMDAELAVRIKENMFVFDDLLRLETEHIMKILQSCEIAEVAVAMKNSTAEDLEKITSAMSQRAKDRFLEETEMLTKVKIKDIEVAQRKMLDAAQVLIDSGLIDRDMEEE